MIRYFPIAAEPFALTVGATPLHALGVVELDAPRYAAEIALKRAQLAEDQRYYFQALPGSELAGWETLDLVLADLARQHPEHFGFVQDGQQRHWRNALLNEELGYTHGDAATLPWHPLDYAGRQVQEDLIVLSAAPGVPLLAGQLCFANAWCLDEKIGKPFLDIHHEVPLFGQQIGRSSQLLMERLRPERPVWRANWSVVATDQLDYSSRWRAGVAARKTEVTAQNAGERTWLRVERQGLARLAQSGAVLFTIHTYACPLAELTAEQASALLTTIQTAPPELLEYKGMTVMLAALEGYLRAPSPQRNEEQKNTKKAI